MAGGPKKPPAGGVAMFDMGAVKKPQIEEPEEPISSLKAAGHKKDPASIHGGTRAMAVGDVLNANMAGGPKKPPPGGVSMFDMGAVKKPQIEEPEEPISSLKAAGHKKDASGIHSAPRMVIPDLANHKLKSVGSPDSSEESKPSQNPDTLAPKPSAKGTPPASKPSFSNAKPAAAVPVPKSDAVKEDDEKIPPWKLELEKRKNFQAAQ
jgi:hypothetical protein